VRRSGNAMKRNAEIGLFTKSSKPMLPIKDHASGLTFRIHVQPRSSHNQIVGLHGDALKIRITAPPVQGVANKVCVEFLAEHIGISRSRVIILSGQAARIKKMLVCCDPADRSRLRRIIHNLSSE